MAVVKSSDKVNRRFPTMLHFAGELADALRESEVFVVKGRNGADVEFHFENNYAYFSLVNVREFPGNNASFKITLFRDGKPLWTWDGEVSLYSFRETFNNFAEFGFPLDGSYDDTYFWGRGARARTAIAQYKKDLMDEGNYQEGDEFFSQRGAPSFDGVSSFGDADEDPESTATPQQLATQQSIVPEDVSSVRVVALKYQGEVIAFRFKTDAGAFDMRKQVAAKYGLGGFKTETYITLESVNGLLMSKSERQKQVCVPDVSDCTEDCLRLMRALFGG